MSDPSESADTLDAGDILRFLATEVQDALVLLSAGASRYGAFRLTGLHVRVGQTPTEDVTEVESALLSDRYPGASRGWEVDLAFEPGASGVVLAVEDATSPATPELASLDGASLFRDRSVEFIRGISTAWTRRLDALGCKSVGDLDDLDDETTAAWASTHGSSIVTFRLLARLLHARLPVLVASPADETSLGSLALITPKALREAVGASRISDTGATLLASALQLYLTALGIGVLREHTLGELRAVASEPR